MSADRSVVLEPPCPPAAGTITLNEVMVPISITQSVRCYPGTHWVVHQGDIKWGGFVRVRRILFNGSGIEVECQDAVSTAAVRRSPARAALAGKGELRQQVWWTPEITARPISCLKRRIQIIKNSLFAPFVGNAVFGDACVCAQQRWLRLAGADHCANGVQW